MPSSRPIDDDVDEIVRRYRAEIFEYEPVAELLVQPAHGVVDLDPVPPVDQKGGVYHHAVAHDLVRSCLVQSWHSVPLGPILDAVGYLDVELDTLRRTAEIDTCVEDPAVHLVSQPSSLCIDVGFGDVLVRKGNSALVRFGEHRCGGSARWGVQLRPGPTAGA